MKNLITIIIAGVGGWGVLSGIVHIIFIWNKLKEGYNRDFFRLLMIGQILIVSGIIQIISYRVLMYDKISGLVLAAVGSMSTITLSIMGSPFLKSIGILILEIIVLLIVISKIFY